MGYQKPILSYENLYKAVTCLPDYLHTQFYKATHDRNLTDGTTNLQTFEIWLEKCIKDLSNPLAEIIAIQKTISKHQQHPKDFMNTILTRKRGKSKRIQTRKNYKVTKGAVLCACFARKTTDLWTVKSSRKYQ